MDIKGSIGVVKDVSANDVIISQQGVRPFLDSVFVSSGNQSRNVASFVDLTGSDKSVNFPSGTKNILVNVGVSSFLTGPVGTEIGFRFVVGSTFGNEFTFYFNTSGEHHAMSFTDIFTGPFSGSQNVRLEWRRASGTGNVNLDFKDNITWSILGFY